MTGGETTNYCSLTKEGSERKLAVYYNDGVSATQPKGTTYYDAEKTPLKEISKSKFKSTLKKLTGGKKITKATFHKNTASKRKKYIK